jgi:hypothetical protein
MSCALCEVRKPRRYCPGVNGDICTICCGTEREVTVDCPFDCVYLQDARRHEKQQPLREEDIPNPGIAVSEGFLENNSALLGFFGGRLLQAAYEVPGLIDFDIRETLQALVRTLQTEQSGLYYETRPANPLAAGVYLLMQGAVAEFRRLEREQLGMQRTRESDVIGVMVFFQRMEALNNNGRRRGRAFIDFLRAHFAQEDEPQTPAAPSSLILP